jgi:hypothetical protein
VSSTFNGDNTTLRSRLQIIWKRRLLCGVLITGTLEKRHIEWAHWDVDCVVFVGSRNILQPAIVPLLELKCNVISSMLVWSRATFSDVRLLCAQRVSSLNVIIGCEKRKRKILLVLHFRSLGVHYSTVLHITINTHYQFSLWV